jgi:hypothetical protein
MNDIDEVVPSKPRRKMKPRSRWKKYKRPGHGELLSEPELAERLGEASKTVRHWRVNGIIPYMVLGHKTIRYRLENVLAALDKRQVKHRRFYEQQI